MMMNRRDALVRGAGTGLFLLTAFGFGTRAFATAGDVDGRIMEITGGRAPETIRINLDVPEIAENGNSVPVSVSVDSAMSGDDMVESISIFADGNPNPDVVTFRFSALSGAAEANTRIRLAQSQNVIALARMADGSVYMDRQPVKVTIGGCGG